MKHLSLVKLFTALFICAVYIFVFGVSGVVGDENVAEDNSSDETENSAPTEVGDDPPPAAAAEFLSFGTPSLSEGFLPSEYVLSELAAQITTEKDLDRQDETDIDESYLDDDVIHIGSEDYDPGYSGEISSGDYEPSSPSSSSSSSKTPSSSSSSKSSSSSSSSKTPSSSSSSKTPSSSSSSKSPSSSSSSKTPSSSSSSKTPSSSSSSKASSSSSSSETSSSSSGSSSSDITIPAEEELWVSNGGEIVRGSAVDIISRIVTNEIGSSFSDEAIKAQAVAAYTNVKRNNQLGSAASVALSNTATDKVVNLVSSVIGEAIYYNGSLIQAVYSASSAGYTASAKNVWGVDYPYLQSIFCELDAEYDPNYGKTQKFSSDSVKSKIFDKTGIDLGGDPSEWLKIVDYVEGKYVGNMTIGGNSTFKNASGKDVKITGRVFRETIMSYGIRSHAFDISYDDKTDEFTFTTYGYGHGVGLSQNGANALAKNLGWDYKQILTFYYQGTTVK